MSSRTRARVTAQLPLGQAIALGVLHGPAELLPVSSSAHVSVVPWLLGWRYQELDVETRKSFEVALHAGTAAALLIALRDEVADAVRGLDRRRLGLIALTFVPPAAAGFALERPVERHLGTPATVAAGLVAGAVALTIADRAPQRRGHDEATARDALWLGVAQASALFPGVSRSGATLATARWLGFTRADAGVLSRDAALPVIAGATALKGVRLKRRGLEPGLARLLAAGAGSAFVSTLIASWLGRRLEGDPALLPFAAYRVALAAAILRRLAG